MTKYTDADGHARIGVHGAIETVESYLTAFGAAERGELRGARSRSHNGHSARIARCEQNECLNRCAPLAVRPAFRPVFRTVFTDDVLDEW